MITKCKDCKINCAYRNALLKRDAEASCIIPMRRSVSAEDGSSIYFMEDLDLNALSKELVDFLMEIVRDERDERKAFKLLEMLIECKKAWCPATQKNIMANVNEFDDKLKRWIEAEKEIARFKKEGGQVYEIVPDIKKTEASQIC